MSLPCFSSMFLTHVSDKPLRRLVFKADNFWPKLWCTYNDWEDGRNRWLVRVAFKKGRVISLPSFDFEAVARMFIGSESAEALQRAGAEARVVLTLVKWKYAFFTELEAFEKPKDAALIGFFAEHIRSQLPASVTQHFDYLFFFEADYAFFEKVYEDSNVVELAQLEEFGDKLVKLVPRENLRFVETEEFLLETVCCLRKRLGIPGLN
ncbi:hypothetical protein L596_027521 [Steinernema carpocapsae]|uniref:Uncharacterized protein n=1 Tax=Steinernema carpocapsae TaxID=34508 RepID=A0A4U5LVS2_STECR|nr:hypothetical protein L596_027521 [Steinernema carpocapsae]